MRKWIISGTVAVLALTLAAVALAGFTQTSVIKFTTHKSGHSTGVSANLVTADDTVSQPKATKKLVIEFPAGTRFNLSALKRCTTSDRKLRDQFGPGCPRGSHIATGEAELNQWQMVATGIPSTVRAYAGKGNIILVVRPTITALKSQIVVLHARLSGSTITVAVPRIMWGADKKSKPPFPGVKVVLVSFKLTIPARGSGSHALVRAGRCAAHKFVVHSRFYYDDGTKFATKTSSPCS